MAQVKQKGEMPKDKDETQAKTAQQSQSHEKPGAPVFTDFASI